MDLLLTNGRTAEGSGALCSTDILIRGGIIAGIRKGDKSEGESIPCTSAGGTSVKVIDLGGALITPGLVDVHVHFREPGRPDKETILTGSRAAAHGGYTCVCTMPNLSPAPDSPETLKVQTDIITEDAVIDVIPYATITKGRAGAEVVDMAALKGSCAGFSDDGSGVQAEGIMEEAMTLAAAQDCIIAAHCEDNSLLRGGYIHDGKYAREHGHRGICSESEWKQIERDIALARRTGCSYHVCHISTKESVAIIRKAKAEGVDITCETGPHYLVLCEDDMREEGRFKMNPPLRSAEDRAALVEGIVDGTIDMIATDHAPHTAQEKGTTLEKCAMGVVGIETAFSVIYTHLVKTGVISLRKALELLCANARRRFRLGTPEQCSGILENLLSPGAPADIAAFDLDREWAVDPAEFLSKGKATPFEGMTLNGKCMLTLHKGEIVWKSNN